MSIDAMKQALEVLEEINKLSIGEHAICLPAEIDTAMDALRQAIEQAEHELATILPDGSAFAVMSWPLPKDHWLYAERQYNDNEYEPVELGKPILTHELRDAVVSAVRYAIRGATNCGKDIDFDPDALVQNAVYALCGPYGQVIQQAEQSEPVAWISHSDNLLSWDKLYDHMEPLYIAPPQRQPLTDEEIERMWDADTTSPEDCRSLYYFKKVARAIEAAHGIKGEA